MRRFDKWDEYPYNKYGNAVALSAMPAHVWMEEHLIKRPLWRESSVISESYYVGDFVGYQSWHTEEGLVMISFEHPENKQRVLDRLPDLVVAADPFGPDCPGCESAVREPRDQADHIPQWLRRLLRIKEPAFA